MGISDEEKFVVVLVESYGRTLDGVQVWGPFNDRTEAKRWVGENGILHLDPYGQQKGTRVFQVTPLVAPVYP